MIKGDSMGTWKSRGLRGSTLEDMVNRTNELSGKGTGTDSEDTDPDHTGANGQRSQTDHAGLFLISAVRSIILERYREFRVF